jgi:hypothetical protein
MVSFPQIAQSVAEAGAIVGAGCGDHAPASPTRIHSGRSRSIRPRPSI